MSMQTGTVDEPRLGGWIAGIASSSAARSLRHFARNPLQVVAAAILVVLAFIAIMAPYIAPYDPTTGSTLDRLQPPFTSGHWLGTDEQGRDVLTRLMYGARISLMIGLLPVGVATIFGMALGTFAGYMGGWINTVIMRTLDALLAFPAILLAIAISAALGAGVENQMIAIAVVFVAPIARVSEAATRQIKVQEFVEAARSGGLGLWTMFRYQIFPNLWMEVFVYASSLVGVSIIFGSGLSFLGLGPAPPTAEWGLMLSSLRTAMFESPWVSVMPGLFIFITALSFNTVSDGLRDSLDVNR